MIGDLLQRDDLRVTVKDAEHRTYMSFPAVAVTSALCPGDRLASGALALPPGNGPLVMILVRIPDYPDLELTGGDQ